MSRCHGGSIINTNDKVAVEGKALHVDNLDCKHPSIVKNIVGKSNIVGSVDFDAESLAVYEGAAPDYGSVVAADQALEDKR